MHLVCICTPHCSTQPRVRNLHILWLISTSGWPAWAWCCADRDSCQLQPSSPLTPRCWDDTCVQEMWTSITSFQMCVCNFFVFNPITFRQETYIQRIDDYRMGCCITQVIFSLSLPVCVLCLCTFSSMWIRKQVTDRSITATV